MALMTVTLVPVRLILIIICFIIGWLISCIACIGITDHDLKEKPLKGWRKYVGSFYLCPAVTGNAQPMVDVTILNSRLETCVKRFAGHCI